MCKRKKGDSSLHVDVAIHYDVFRVVPTAAHRNVQIRTKITDRFLIPRLAIQAHGRAVEDVPASKVAN